MTKPPKFDLEDDQRLNVPTAVQQESLEHQIFAYGTLNAKFHPTVEWKGKIPVAVSEFINANKSDSAPKTLIYAKILELGMEEMRRQLVVADVEIKY